MFGFKRRRAAKAAAEAKRLEEAKRRALADIHGAKFEQGTGRPFSTSSEVRRVIAAKDADTLHDNIMMNPASPLYVGHGYQAPASQHDAPACNTGHSSHSSHDSGSSYSSDAGSSSGSGDSGGSSGGCD